MLLLVEAKKNWVKKSFSRVSDFIQKYFWQAQTDKIENKDFEIFATWNLEIESFSTNLSFSEIKNWNCFSFFFFTSPSTIKSN